MRERETGASRGFGFVTFATAASADAAKGTHDIAGKQVEAKASVAAGTAGTAPPSAPGAPVHGDQPKKLFVGGATSPPPALVSVGFGWFRLGVAQLFSGACA